MLGTALTFGGKLYFGTGINSNKCFEEESGRCWYPAFSDCSFRNCSGTSGMNEFEMEVFSDFHSFDESGLSWVAHDKVPGAGRVNAVSMVIDEQGYLGMGRQVDLPRVRISSFFASSTPLTDFHRFDENQSPGNQWTQMDDFPDDYSAAKGFGIVSKGYAIATMPESDLKKFWQFDPNASAGQQWQTLPNFPTAAEGTPQAAVVIGTKAFVYFNTSMSNFWMYVPELE